MALPRTCLPSDDDTHTGSSASLSRIKTWLDICSSSHPACSRADSQPPPLPTRVIAVGSKGASKCQLVSGNKKNGYYATLSHCWGDPQKRPLLTTDRTLSCRQRGIEDEALPKTFRHAVEVCRALGIEYIWIDSLCIIQEQETQEDWAKEAPRMGLVYGNSSLNISALAAADSTRGCFKERLGQTVWPCPILLFGKACYLSRYPTQKEEIDGDPGDLEYDILHRLTRRAWVLQEQALSRRSIIFSKNRLIWRCPTLSTNEKYPLGIPHAPKTSIDNHRLLYCIVNGIASSIPDELKIDFYACWYRTVAEYTSRNLTYEEDRLSAVAGIAKRFGMAVNDNYHAGLWRHDMILGLLWRASVDVTRKARSARAPSWSWASINGHVVYDHPLSTGADARRMTFSPLVYDLDVLDPETCEDHPYGVNSRASLSLSGVLLAVMKDLRVESGLILVENDNRVADDSKRIFSNNFERIFSDGSGLTFFSDVWKSDRPDRAPLFCLPVCVTHGCFVQGSYSSDKASWAGSLKRGIDKCEGSNTLYCLVLKAVEGKQDTYSRVGLCKVGSHKIMEISRMALFGERRSMTLV